MQVLLLDIVPRGQMNGGGWENVGDRRVTRRMVMIVGRIVMVL